MPCSRHSAETSRTFASDTGWPPAELFVSVSMHSGMRAAPTSAMSPRSAGTSRLPLKGEDREGSRPSGQSRSTARAPVASTLARVVSKCVLFGTTSPGLHTVLKRIRSAARPWCVGITTGNPKMSRTAASKRNQLRAPA
jgi:hypothetical protein